MAGKIETRQMSAIYATAKQLGIVVPGSHEDGLHDLVRGLTGKDGVKELSRDEANQVLGELRVREQGLPAPPPERKRIKKAPADSPAGMTGGQQQKAWALMFQLQKLDPSPVSLGDRLCGVIEKVLAISAKPAEPFQWLDYRKGCKLIEVLKGYVQSVERQLQRGGERNGSTG